MNIKSLAFILLALATSAACKGQDDSSGGGGGSASGGGGSANAAGCPYKGKSGFCLAPPAGDTPTESGDTVIFKRVAKPDAAQDLLVVTESFPMTPEILKSRRDFARKGSGVTSITVLEDVDIAGGKGFYVATQTPTNIVVNAIVPNGPKMYTCTFNAHARDKDALKSEIQACKSLKIAN